MLVPMMLFAIMQPGPSDVYIRVVDVGPGLCTITEAPGEHYIWIVASRRRRCGSLTLPPPKTVSSSSSTTKSVVASV